MTTAILGFVRFPLQSAVKSMDEYVSIPARRLAHLVAKYVHHIQMKQVEGER